MPYFEDRLLDLLPPIYQERDESGDLRAFLAIPAVTLDEIKGLIDALPDIWNVDACDSRFLSLLSEIVGYRYDPTRDPDMQRREIREVVEQYRRKGSIPAIQRALINMGWQGEIEETFRGALRLSKRSKTNSAKLPGHIYSLGVYRIESRNIVPTIRETLRPQHPAGMRVFFLQWLFSQESADDAIAVLRRTISLHSIGRIREAFVVGRRLLNSDYCLTKKQTTWSYWTITSQTTVTQGFESAGVLINRWHGRMPGPRLNGFILNSKRLLNVELSERRLAFACEVETAEPGASPIVFRLVRERLNRSKLKHATRSCRILFRQKSLTCAVTDGLECAANLYMVTQWPQG